MDGQAGASLLRLVASARAIPVHYDDYDNFSSRLRAFAQAVRASGTAAHCLATAWRNAFI